MAFIRVLSSQDCASPHREVGHAEAGWRASLLFGLLDASHSMRRVRGLGFGV